MRPTDFVVDTLELFTNPLELRRDVGGVVSGDDRRAQCSPFPETALADL